MARIPQPYLFGWKEIDAASDLDRLRLVLDVLPDEDLVSFLEETPRNFGGSIDACIKRLNEYLRGWMGFFKICTGEVEKERGIEKYV
jgi:hypothetical protein